MKYLVALSLVFFLTHCAPTPEPVADTTPTQKTADSIVVKTGEIVGNLATQKYHVAPCYYIPLIKQTRRFTTIQQAKDAGYTCDSASNGCRSCSK